MFEITVVNKKTGGKGTYIGRPSALGNPFSVEQYGRGNCIARYDTWLNEQIQSGNRLVCEALNQIYEQAQSQPVSLVCWCAPAPCHGNVIKRVIVEAHSARKC